MSQELVLSTDMSYEALAQITGQSNDKVIDTLPKLSINRDFETDDNKKIPPGTFKLTSSAFKTPVYGKPVVFRPYINAYQYIIYDDKTNTYPNKSILFKNWNDEAIDEKGGTKCGKLTGKQKDKITAEQLELQKIIKCYRNLYGTVTMQAVDEDENIVEVEDVPVLWRSRGSSFIVVGDTLKILAKSKRPCFTQRIKFELKREKQGSNVYYVPVPTIDIKDQRGVTEVDLELLKKFQATIDYENGFVIKKYKAAISAQSEDEIAQEIIESGFIDITGDDFQDKDLGI